MALRGHYDDCSGVREGRVGGHCNGGAGWQCVCVRWGRQEERSWRG